MQYMQDMLDVQMQQLEKVTAHRLLPVRETRRRLECLRCKAVLAARPRAAEALRVLTVAAIHGADGEDKGTAVPCG